MSDSNYNILSLTADGANTATINTPLGLFSITTKYNYSAACWVADIQDVNGATIIAGLMLIPNTDLLLPYPAVRSAIGTLLLVEQVAGNYTDPNGLGIYTRLLWFDPTSMVEIPS